VAEEKWARNPEINTWRLAWINRPERNEEKTRLGQDKRELPLTKGTRSGAHPHSFTVLILAAGSSTRMGQPKQLLKWKDQTLLNHAAKTALDSGAFSTVVVLGSGAEQSRLALDNLPVEIVINPDWEKGMGSSLKKGVDHILKKLPPSAGVVVMVCDQPMITSKHLQQLFQKHMGETKLIIATRYADTFGVPAFFQSSLLPSMLALGDEEGAKKYIQQNMQRVDFVDFDDAKIDLDTPEDFANFKAK
jgi:molybdenum cofactor cytidylyltransferase